MNATTLPKDAAHPEYEGALSNIRGCTALLYTLSNLFDGSAVEDQTTELFKLARNLAREAYDALGQGATGPVTEFDDYGHAGKLQAVLQSICDLAEPHTATEVGRAIADQMGWLLALAQDLCVDLLAAMERHYSLITEGKA